MTKISIRIIVLLLLCIVVLGGGYAWWTNAISPVNLKDTQVETFVVQPGEGVRSIATRLKAEGLIRNQIAFFLITKFKGLDTAIQAGDFRLSASMDSQTIAEELTHGVVDVWVTILEGWRNEEIALKLAQTHQIPENEFLKFAREGYMYPDTYLLPKEASAAAVATLLEETFNTKVTTEVRTAIEAQGLTLAEGIVLASLVEREGRSDTDRPVIAGILLNRLRDDHPLQVDATLQYALGYQSNTKSWWKKELYNEDKEVNSPFNTYKNVGLPPAPIANPGLGSITAVAYPQDSEYYYYIHDTDGQAHYAQTLEQHNENVRNYLQ